MKKFYLTLLMTLSLFTVYGQIKQVNTMDEVFAYFNDADGQTLAIFDVDLVLIQPSDPAFQMANMKRFSSNCKKIIKEVPPDKLMMFFGLMGTKSDSILLDNRLSQFFQELCHKGISAMALTAGLTGEFDAVKSMENKRVDDLNNLGIDFSKTAPIDTSIVFDDLAAYRGNFPVYLNGVFFTNGMVVSKGEAFLSFLKKTNIRPDRIIFIDDMEENLKSFEVVLMTLDKPIEYVGLHFIGAQNYPSKQITEEEFELKWKNLVLKVKRMD